MIEQQLSKYTAVMRHRPPLSRLAYGNAKLNQKSRQSQIEYFHNLINATKTSVAIRSMSNKDWRRKWAGAIPPIFVSFQPAVEN
jgi:hypothetical protein